MDREILLHKFLDRLNFLFADIDCQILEMFALVCGSKGNRKLIYLVEIFTVDYLIIKQNRRNVIRRIREKFLLGTILNPPPMRTLKTFKPGDAFFTP